MNFSVIKTLDWGLQRYKKLIAFSYLIELAGLPDLILLEVCEGAQSVWHVFAIRSSRRGELRKHLTQVGIGTLIHYPVPPHLSGAYQNQGLKKDEYPLAEQIANTILSLPIGPHLTIDCAEIVARKVRAFQ